MSSEISSSFYGRLDPPVPEVWPFPIPPSPTIASWTGDREAELILSEQSGRKKRRVSAAPTMSEDESSKLASTSSGNDPTVCEVKRLRSSRNLKAEAEASSGVCNKPIKKNSQPSEAPKSDFIHVRARRGQATDNHSLAERARREKISERMKMLQGLVPGCSKVIGKASVLDEIINYIQALQNQVEFLSMKLETVNSLMDIGIEGFPPKDRGPEDLYGNLNFTTMMLQHPSPSEEREPESLVQTYDSLLVSHSAHDQH